LIRACIDFLNGFHDASNFVARDIAVTWLLTIPVSALLAVGLYLLVALSV
jgi:phosphate/sulfate permease